MGEVLRLIDNDSVIPNESTWHVCQNGGLRLMSEGSPYKLFSLYEFSNLILLNFRKKRILRRFYLMFFDLFSNA